MGRASVGVGVLLCCANSGALAQDVANVTTNALNSKLALEYRAELMHTDQGLTSTKAKEASSAQVFRPITAKLKLLGQFNKSTEYAFRFNLNAPGVNTSNQAVVMDYGGVRIWVTDMIGVGIGKALLMQGGFDLSHGGFKAHQVGAHQTNGVQYQLPTFVPMVELTAKVMGKVQVQIFDDVVSNGTDGRFNKSPHTTFAVAYTGAFGPIEPRVEYGTYDNQKSNWMNLGVRATMAGATVQADLLNNNVNKRAVSTSGKAEEKKNVATTIVTTASYELKNLVTPYVFFSNFNYTDATKDIKGNSFNPQTKAPIWNDNATTVGAAVEMRMLAKGSPVPFVAFTKNSGDWLTDPTKPADSKVEAKSETWLRFGMYGEF